MPVFCWQDDEGVRWLEDDLRAANTGAGGVADQRRPSHPSGLLQRAVEFGDEVRVDEHVTDIEVVAWRRLHDVVERGGVGTEMLRERAVDHLQVVAALPRASSPRPVLDHRPVDVGEAQLVRAVDPRHLGADSPRERITGRHGVERRPREQRPPPACRLVADPGEELRADALAPPIAKHEHVALHDPRVARRVRPAEPGGNRRAVGGLDQPGVVVELRRQVASEGDVGLDRLWHPIRSALGLDRRLDGV